MCGGATARAAFLALGVKKKTFASENTRLNFITLISIKETALVWGSTAVRPQSCARPLVHQKYSTNNCESPPLQPAPEHLRVKPQEHGRGAAQDGQGPRGPLLAGSSIPSMRVCLEDIS